MLGRSPLCRASKSTGGTTKYQRRPSIPPPLCFQYEVGGLAKGGTLLRRQKNKYTRYFDRDPQFYNGRNVHMNPKSYALFALKDGLLTVRPGVTNKKYRIVDIEDNIAMVKTQRSMRQELELRGEVSHMTERNEHYADELMDMRQKDWRLEAQRKLSPCERFPDPNLLTRGLVASIDPKPRYTTSL